MLGVAKRLILIPLSSKLSTEAAASVERGKGNIEAAAFATEGLSIWHLCFQQPLRNDQLLIMGKIKQL